MCDTQQLLQSVRVELQVHEHMKNSTHTHTGAFTHTLVMPEHAVKGGLRHCLYLCVCVQVRAVALDLRAVQQWI